MVKNTFTKVCYVHMHGPFL